jgi:hypothetical protein
MSERPTPETDACAKSIDQSNFEDSWKDDFEEFAWVPADFARQLERERDEAKQQLRIAVGLLSTQPQFADKHPEDVLDFVKEGAK